LAFHADVAGDPKEAEFCYEIIAEFKNKISSARNRI
jgi:hypothetical protein